LSKAWCRKIRVAIIDAEIINKAKHRFPNLACMKISAYHKSLNDTVDILLSYENLNQYDKVYVSKVFQDTYVPEKILTLPNVISGGTGFYFGEDGLLIDEPPPLPDQIEHIMPDYHLYDDWIEQKVSEGFDIKEFRFYTDFSIGFTTRGCFRKCWYCVNKFCNKSVKHSPVEEFYDKSRKKILLLDDNVLACKDWREIFESLQETNKPFQYKQGMDERILTEDKCDTIFNKSKWNEDYIFAFDNYLEKDLIESKLKLIRKVFPNNTRTIKFYVFCAGRNPERTYDDFWATDIDETFDRIKILASYKCLPYVMRFKDWKDSPYSGLYSAIASWGNQPSIFKKFTFRKFCIERGMNPKVYKQYKGKYDQYLADGYKKGACWRYMEQFEQDHPEIAAKYYDWQPTL
jgi:hypothetical protein